MQSWGSGGLQNDMEIDSDSQNGWKAMCKVGGAAFPEAGAISQMDGKRCAKWGVAATPCSQYVSIYFDFP